VSSTHFASGNLHNCSHSLSHGSPPSASKTSATSSIDGSFSMLNALEVFKGTKGGGGLWIWKATLETCQKNWSASAEYIT
jgi:hypothetical protein